MTRTHLLAATVVCLATTLTVPAQAGKYAAGCTTEPQAGWKAVDKFIAENALVLPLLQYVQPIIAAPGVIVTPHKSGALLPYLMKRG